MREGAHELARRCARWRRRGRTAAQMRVAEQYLRFGNIAKEANTVLLPADAEDSRRLWSRRPWPPPARRERGRVPSGPDSGWGSGTRREDATEAAGTDRAGMDAGTRGARGDGGETPDGRLVGRDSARRRGAPPRRRSRPVGRADRVSLSDTGAKDGNGRVRLSSD